MLLASHALSCLLTASAGQPTPPPPPVRVSVPAPVLPQSQSQSRYTLRPGRLLTPYVMGAGAGRYTSGLVIGGYGLIGLGAVLGVVGIAGGLTAQRAHTQVLGLRTQLDDKNDARADAQGERESVEAQLFDPNLSDLERDILEGQLGDLDDTIELLDDDINVLELQRDSWTRRRGSGVQTGIVGGVVGGTLLLTGASLLIVHAVRARKTGERRVSFAPSLGRESWGLSLSGAF